MGRDGSSQQGRAEVEGRTGHSSSLLGEKEEKGQGDLEERVREASGRPGPTRGLAGCPAGVD